MNSKKKQNVVVNPCVNKNYLESIKPGETVTVHMAWIVTQEELGRLYLSLDTYGGAWHHAHLSVFFLNPRQIAHKQDI